jgi:S1/P1 Nuclease
MKKVLSFLISLSLPLVAAAPTFGWGEKGHETVGFIAEMTISRVTAAKIKTILQPGESLGTISTWADSVKYRIGEHDPDPDTDAFLQDAIHNHENSLWHYVDLPLGCMSYQACPEFTRDYDIVQMINVCIATLQGHPNPNHPMSKRNALRFLVHFIGDLHQPLHVGVGFIDATNPNQIKIATDRINIAEQNYPGDRGGNQLIIDNDRANLHSFWDFELVTQLMNQTHQTSSRGLAQLLRTSSRPLQWVSSSPIQNWGTEWANDSLRVSRTQTYRGVHILRQRSIPVLRNGQPVVSDGQTVMQTVYDISLPADYSNVNRNVVRRQLTKAGFRLAKLLDKIFS